eukprot:CAMPEP_0198232068 /NCGR_PEP_ID=MMETSP1445-20131203/115532_1 /TAXON_ID=36898 /ORGANISM="Pyramimonas sp., Strain CCMP2087" /LENGTH=378 /DNA_ID=CAMNT_0043912715 /DNA_START=416 /DNA_END=1553 /DNA_ORIENTATION=-
MRSALECTLLPIARSALECTSAPTYSNTAAGVPILKVDPDRDGLLFKQHEYGIAKQRLSRLKAYEKYLTLTTREKKLLEFDQKENLEQIEQQGLKESYVFISKAAQQDMEVWRMAEERDDQIQSNLEEIQDAKRNYMRKIRDVNERWEEASLHRRTAWDLETQRRKDSKILKARIQNVIDKKIRGETNDYMKRIKAVEQEKEAHAKSKIEDMRESIEIQKIDKMHKREEKKEAVVQWKTDMRARLKEARAKPVVGHIQGLNQWEEKLLDRLETEEEKREEAKDTGRQALRERSKALKARLEEFNMRADMAIEAKREERLVRIEAMKALKKKREEQRINSLTAFKRISSAGKKDFEQRVEERRKAYLHELGLADPPPIS